MHKVANFSLTEIQPYESDQSLVKTASTTKIDDAVRKVVEAEIKKHPSGVFFIAKAIEAEKSNNNGDSFSEKELVRACPSFVGVPFFTNHQNQDIEKAKGKVVHAWWNPADRAIYVVAFVDGEAYPQLARGIREKYITGVSMGCAVDYSVCSICENKAATVDEYCTHIRNFKGRKFTGTAKNVRTGDTKTFKGALVYEDNFGVRFIELSGVTDPACPTCHIQQVLNGESSCAVPAAVSATGDEAYLIKAAASLYNDVAIIKEAALEKEASQADVQSLNQCLVTLEQVSIKIIQNRANVDMEFASDLVTILADLQDFVNELVQAGYGQLPEAAGAGVPGSPETAAGSAAAPAAAAPAIPAPAQPVAAEATVPGTTNVEEPLLQPPALPAGLEALRETTRPAPQKSTGVGQIARPARPERAKKAEEGCDMRRRLPNKAANDKKRTQEILSGDWQEKLGFFSKSLSETLRRDPAVSNMNGGHHMSSQVKTVEAKSQNSDLHTITEKQLESEKKPVAISEIAPRSDDTAEVVTEKQLEAKRKGEVEVVTEKQLDGKNPNARTDDTPQIIGEKQLESVRKGAAPEVITQKQLEDEGKKVDDEKHVVTEKQLSSPAKDTPWARSAASVSKHVESAVSTLAKTVVATGSTPEQVVKAAASMAGDAASERLAFANEIWTATPDSSDLSDLVAQASYWGGKSVKLGTASHKTIREALVSYASAAVAAAGLNPEYLVEAFVGVNDSEAVDQVESKVGEILAAKKAATKVSVKDEIASVLRSKKTAKESGDLLQKAAKVPDVVIETSAKEMGVTETKGASFDSAVKMFAAGACASKNLKLASVTNVTVDGDTVTIAVETENESVEIPIGEKAEEESPIDMTPEEPIAEAPLPEVPAAPEVSAPAPEAGLGAAVPPPPPPPAAGPLAASKTGVKKTAQLGATPEVPPGGAGAAAPEQAANLPDMGLPAEGGIQTFTKPEGAAEEEGLPGGEQQMAGTICPICGGNDTETGKKDQSPGQFDCNTCGAKYIMHVNIEVLNPEEMWEGAEKEKGMMAPEAPELPVAAFVDVSKGLIQKFSSSFQEGKVSCPACGKTAKAEGTPSSHKVTCAACGTVSTRDVVINVDKPEEAKVKVAWLLDPKKRKCAGCEAARKAFAAEIAFQRMLKSASTMQFPEAKAAAWVAKNYGKDAKVTYGQHTGEKLAEVIVGQLKAFGLDKVVHMRKLCEIQTQADPMEACVGMHRRKGYTVREARRLCDCLKDKYASEADTNIFLQAFDGSMDVEILRRMASHFGKKAEAAKPEAKDSDKIADLGEEMPDTAPAAKGIKFEGQEALFGKKPAIAAAAQDMKTGAKEQDMKVAGDTVPKRVELPDKQKGISSPQQSLIKGEKETSPKAAKPDVPRSEEGAKIKGEKEANPKGADPTAPMDNALMGEEKTQGPEINKETLGLVVTAGEDKKTPRVKNLEDEAKPPRGDALLGHEGEVSPKAAEPTVPRSPDGAKMKGEKETSPTAAERTAPIDDARMGHEQQIGPAISDKTLGQVTSESAQAVKISEQKAKIMQARREKAVRLAAKLVGAGAVKDSEFEETVTDLMALPLDRMEVMAQRIASSSTRKEASLSQAVVIEDTPIKAAEEKSLTQKIAGMFTVGNTQADRFFKKGDLDEE